MRKIYSFIIAAAAVAASACTQELENKVQEQTGETVVFCAYTDGTDVKATLNEDTKCSEWESGDAIAIFNGIKGFEFKTEDSGAKADFTYTGNDFSGNKFMAVYPYGDYTADIENKIVTANVPTYQPSRNNDYSAGAVPAVAYSEDMSLKFKNASALLKFTVKGSNVKGLIFYGHDNEAVSGNVRITLDEDNTVKSVEALETTITENEITETKLITWVKIWAQTDDYCFDEGVTYYLSVVPQNFTKGFTAQLEIDGVGVVDVKSTSQPYDLKPNTILNLGEFSYDAPEANEWAVAGGFNEWSMTANPMTLEGDFYVLKGVTGLNFTPQEDDADLSSASGFQFISKGTAWKGGYGDTQTPGKLSTGSWSWYWEDGGKNIYVDGADADDAFDIYLNPVSKKFVIVSAGDPMPEDVVAPEPEYGYWAVVGSMTDGWNSEIKMELDGDWYVARGVEVASDAKFKFRADGDWDITRGAGDAKVPAGSEVEVSSPGNDISVTEPAVYDIFLSKDTYKMKLEKVGDIVVVEPGTTTPGEDSEWAVYAQFGSETWSEVMMKTTTREGLFVVENKTMNAYNKLLIKKYNDNDWKVKYGSYDVNYIKTDRYFTVASNGGDVFVEAAGTYDIYFDYTNTMVYLMSAGSDYASATEQIESGKAPVVESGTRLYLKPNSNWMQSNARFAVYTWDGGDQWFDMKDSDSDGIYEVLIPEGIVNIIFCRMNPGASANGWGNKWNQTGDLKVPTDGKNLYTVKESTWDKGGGTWSVK